MSGDFAIENNIIFYKGYRLWTVLSYSREMRVTRQTIRNWKRTGRIGEINLSGAEFIIDTLIGIVDDRRILTRHGKVLDGKQYDWFMLFWEAYNHKRGKAEAADAWLKLKIQDFDLVQKIVDGAKKEAAYREKMTKTKEYHPKYPQGWLTGRRWEDDINYDWKRKVNIL